jgi:hypothetical protein
MNQHFLHQRHSTFFQSKTFRWQDLPIVTRERLQIMKENANDPLRFQKIERPAVWMFRWLPPIVSIVYLHPTYLIVFHKETVQIFSWAYLSQIKREPGTLELGFVQEADWIEEIRVSTDELSKQYTSLKVEVGERAEPVLGVIEIFAKELREKNSSQKAHLALEAELFLEMLQDETA